MQRKTFQAVRRKLLIISFLLVASLAAFSQDKHVIQFTGIVMQQDSLTVIPGVHVYVPKAYRGTTSNPYGFFSMPVVEGDSVVFTAVGFKRASYVIPNHESSSSLKVLVILQEDVTFLQEVEVFPFPTEAMFKQAVITMELPYNRDFANMQAWINATYMKNPGPDYFGASASANHRYIMDQQRLEFQNKFGPQPNNLLNPFAWASFIRSLKQKN
jgi:hypothetical protein